MTRKLIGIAIAFAIGTIGAPLALADTFTFNVDYCSNPCLGGVPASNNGGTVSVTQNVLGAGGVGNVVELAVQLASGLLFHDQGLESFVFNIINNPALTLVTTLSGSGQVKINNAGGSTWTFSQPAGNTDGAGSTFGYSFDCAAGSGHCAGSPSFFDILVELNGLTPASFETRSGSGGSTVNVDFAANVANGTCTGMIGAGNGTSQSTAATANTGGTPCSLGGGGGSGQAVPEPTSVVLLGTALLFAGKLLKTKLTV